MKVGILRYNAGNTASVRFALERLGVNAEVTDDPAKLAALDKVIIPGVGEAASAMKYLRERRLDVVIRSLGQPVLGICLGMQILCEFSEENDTECLGIVPGRVRRFASAGDLKIPHIGWNTIEPRSDSRLFAGIAPETHFYFVHGFYVERTDHESAVCRYGKPFAAAFERENYYGVQFHPERSASAGEKVLRNFLSL